MKAETRSINDLFNGARTFEIPFFQRSYVWDVPQWERFISDMEFITETGKPYFLGSVILKQELAPTGQDIGDKRTVIDGQQRITTLCLFLKVLSLKLNKPYLDCIYRIHHMPNENIAVLHNRNDEADFMKVLNLTTLEELPGESQVFAAYTYFCNNIDEHRINHDTILTKINFVGIDLVPDEDEQRIFDTINSLGVTLTTAELLKNYFFSRDDIQYYTENWYDIFEKEDVRPYWDTTITAGRITRSLLDLFFYSFLQIKIQDPAAKVSTEDKKIYSKVEGLFESYKDYIKNYNIDKKELIKEIREYADIFRTNFDLTVTSRALPEEPCIDRISAIIFGLENTTLIPYVLYLLKNFSDKKNLTEIFDYLEAYIMRRIVSKANTKNYNQLFGERLIINQVADIITLHKHIDNQADLVNAMPFDKAVEDGFKSSKLNNKQATGILYLLETKIRNSQKRTTAMLGLGSYSLEHIMPKKWVNHWPALKDPAEIYNRNQKLLTLGNLTIITQMLNAAISDSPWEDKKKGKNNDGLEAYTSDLATFSPYLTEKDWNEATIEKRTADLAVFANKVWKA